ncbi:hypothetical protein IJ847_00185, partial [Candidatus Saccharibacteria bacterium]|nr:hypothetical protein [Candidatus Saccharibacteria bacterium]
MNICNSSWHDRTGLPVLVCVELKKSAMGGSLNWLPRPDSARKRALRAGVASEIEMQAFLVHSAPGTIELG